MEIILQCPECKNNNCALFGISERRREQMTVTCQKCNHTWVYVFANVKPEDPLSLLKKEMDEQDARTRASTTKAKSSTNDPVAGS